MRSAECGLYSVHCTDCADCADRTSIVLIITILTTLTGLIPFEFEIIPDSMVFPNKTLAGCLVISHE